jgi:hypothetical protein
MYTYKNRPLESIIRSLNLQFARYGSCYCRKNYFAAKGTLVVCCAVCFYSAGTVSYYRRIGSKTATEPESNLEITFLQRCCHCKVVKVISWL